MASDVSGVEPAPAELSPLGTAPSPAAPIGEESSRPPHWRRFVIIYGLLALALGSAIAGVVVFAGRSITAGPAWSSWRPSGGGLGSASQIAEHVAPMYRLPSGTQLVEVIAKPPSVSSGSQTIPLHYLVVQGSKRSQDQVSTVSPSNTIMFSMCGLGPTCSIASGTPSVERGRLVRREVLELSLFAFKYIGGIDNVIAFMPTVSGAQPSVVYLRKSDLNAALRQPLDKTLSPKTPLPNTIPAREVRTVDATTEARVFPFTVVQTQFGDWAMVLKPLSA